MHRAQTQCLPLLKLGPCLRGPLRKGNDQLAFGMLSGVTGDLTKAGVLGKLSMLCRYHHNGEDLPRDLSFTIHLLVPFHYEKLECPVMVFVALVGVTEQGSICGPRLK